MFDAPRSPALNTAAAAPRCSATAGAMTEAVVFGLSRRGLGWREVPVCPDGASSTIFAYGLVFTDDRNGWLAGPDELAHTSDAGVTWSVDRPPRS